jgi:hypothetical protein
MISYSFINPKTSLAVRLPMDLGGPAPLTPLRVTARGEKRPNSSIRPVKRFFALLVGGLGIRALLRRRGRPEPASAPAEELRARLAETKVEPAAPAAEPVDDVDARRADVHERARRAMDELGES